MTCGKRRRSSQARRRRWRIALALAGLGVTLAFAAGGGARAQRSAAVAVPTLESLLQQRDALGPQAPPTPAAPDKVRGHYEELRQRRADIDGSLPRALRTPASRRPELRAPQRDLVARRAAKAIDADPDNPDRVAFEVK